MNTEKTDTRKDAKKAEGSPSRFTRRLEQAMELRGLRSADLSRSTGIDKSVLSGYRHGRYQAKHDNLEALAKALNVSAAWLVGQDVPMEPPSPPPVLEDDPLDRQLFAAWGEVKGDFTQEEMDDLTLFMGVMAERRRKKRETEVK